MTDTHPGVEDELEHALRLGLATAAQLADRLARARQDHARDAQHRTEAENRQLEARVRAEGASATARLAVVDRPEWWDRATGEDVAAMYELAVQWRDEQPRAAVAAETIGWQVQDRYGTDVHAPGVDPGAVRDALARVELERAGRTEGPERGQDSAAAIAAVVRADQRDAALASGTDRAPGYDSAERREDMAEAMRESGLPAETIAVAMRADVAHARPAADAAEAGGKRAGGARIPQGRSAGRGAQRFDRER